MPPFEPSALLDAAITACLRQPGQAADLRRIDLNAIGHVGLPVLIVTALATTQVEQLARDLGQVDTSRIFFLDFILKSIL